MEKKSFRKSIIVPEIRRKCTDPICLLFIVVTWIVLTVIGLASIGIISIKSLQAGNPQLLLHGVDYKGNICGLDPIVTSLPYRIFPNFFMTNPSSTGAYVPVLFSICVSSCPNANEIISDPYNTYGTWNTPYDSSNFVNDCLYISESRESTSGLTILSDFVHSAAIIALLGFLAAVVCSFLFLTITRIPMVLRSVVWLCVFLIFAVFAGGGYFLLTEAKHQDSLNTNNATQTEIEIQLLKAVGGILCVCAVIWLCFICFLRKQIALAIQLIRESASALLHMPLLCFLPLLQIVCYGGFTCIWMIYCLYLVTSGEKVVETDSLSGLTYISYEYSTTSKYAILFMFFAWLWSIAWLESIGQITAAHAVITWYFAPCRYEISSLQLLSSFLMTLRYHMGTAAFGSFLLAMVRFWRMVLEYVKYHLTRSYHRAAANTAMRGVPGRSCLQCPGNFLMQFTFCCLTCLLSFFEKCVQFLNKQAYVQVAIFGTSFVTSAFNGFYLIVRNLGRLAAVNMVGDFVVFIGKLSISLSTAVIGYLYMSVYLRDQLNGFILPTLLIGFLAYMTATMFLNVLSATADALLQACILDEQYDIISSIEAAKSAKKAKESVTVKSEESNDADIELNDVNVEEEVVAEADTAEEIEKVTERRTLRTLIIHQAKEWKLLSASNYHETEAELEEQEEMIAFNYHETNNSSNSPSRFGSRFSRNSNSSQSQEAYSVLTAGISRGSPIDEEGKDNISSSYSQPSESNAPRKKGNLLSSPPAKPPRPVPSLRNNDQSTNNVLDNTSKDGRKAEVTTASDKNPFSPGSRTNRYAVRSGNGSAMNTTKSVALTVDTHAAL